MRTFSQVSWPRTHRGHRDLRALCAPWDETKPLLTLEMDQREENTVTGKRIEPMGVL